MDETIYAILKVLSDFALEMWFSICCGYSKELSKWGSLVHPRYMLKLIVVGEPR